MKRALIAISGGVDSSACAYLMKNAGYECVGVTMKLHSSSDSINDGCVTTQDIEDAKRVCETLEIPYHVVDFSGDFERLVIESFVRAYELGATPNPCIECNYHLKFNKLFEHGRSLGYDYIATGHYARIEYDEKYGRKVLKVGLDASKDQSYVLYRLSKEQIEHTLFPLGSLSKSEVREIARLASLDTSTKKESQDICFIPDGDYATFIEKYTKKRYTPGNFVTLDGKILGQHRGIIRYTIGQGKGLGLALPHRMYVCEKRLDTNEVVIGDNEDLFSRELWADSVCLSAIDTIDAPIRVQAKVRYKHIAQNATATLENGLLHIVFDEPQRAICKGQAVVIYDGEVVLGGGSII
ncbi:MAG: tRNA 2-thiouridine(34) synthase MnmA [Clostridia bacterium]|nr:tRNA 2-thiouridine(34) synthase MnmA [Clostridia bacterium]MBR2296590.1 tRNA 2-thiouridine(34) synthase MnmA [Clostridia bacterium]